jgi:hypothetical protein
MGSFPNAKDFEAAAVAHLLFSTYVQSVASLLLARFTYGTDHPTETDGFPDPASYVRDKLVGMVDGKSRNSSQHFCSAFYTVTNRKPKN